MIGFFNKTKSLIFQDRFGWEETILLPRTIREPDKTHQGVHKKWYWRNSRGFNRTARDDYDKRYPAEPYNFSSMSFSFQFKKYLPISARLKRWKHREYLANHIICTRSAPRIPLRSASYRKLGRMVASLGSLGCEGQDQGRSRKYFQRIFWARGRSRDVHNSKSHTFLFSSNEEIATCKNKTSQ